MKLTCRPFALAVFAALAAASQSAPILTLDASNASSLSLTGSAVNAWRNSTGGQSFAPLSAAPTYVPNAINGHGAIDFAGANALVTSAFGGTYANLTFFLVVAPRTNTGGYNAFLSDRTGGNNDYSTGFNLDMTNSATSSFSTFNVEGTKGGGGGGNQLKTDSSPFGTYQILSLTYSTLTQLYVNGAAEGSANYNSNSVPFDNLVVGGRYYTNSPTGGYYGFLDGRIAELRIYDGALGTTDRQAIESELRTKYFTPVPEPGTWVALGLGAITLVKRRKRA